jgi:uncharacterized integral membrane protein
MQDEPNIEITSRNSLKWVLLVMMTMLMIICMIQTVYAFDNSRWFMLIFFAASSFSWFLTIVELHSCSIVKVTNKKTDSSHK